MDFDIRFLEIKCFNNDQAAGNFEVARGDYRYTGKLGPDEAFRIAEFARGLINHRPKQRKEGGLLDGL